MVDILIDLSASAAITPLKSALIAGLSALLVQLASDEGQRPQVWVFGAGARRLGVAWSAELRVIECAGAAGFDAPAPRLRPGSERILIGDGLTPAGAAEVVRRLGERAGRIALVQVLTRDEREPSPRGAMRLHDVEGGHRDLVVDERAVAAYRARLASHQDDWHRVLRGRGAGVATCIAEDGVDAALRVLLSAGLVEAV
jgi:hypothetical protein